MICVGIVTFNPDIERLKNNLDAIVNQTNKIIVFDNNSKNLNLIKTLVENYYNVVIIENNNNYGIAYALNRIAEESIKYKYKWCLCLDQDSICYPNIISFYKKYIDRKNVGMLTCYIKDRNFKYESDDILSESYVDKCITSGSVIKLEAWQKVGGFDDKMFIDYVDTDMCIALKENGFKILKIPCYGILHEVGKNTKKIKIFGREIVIFNHSSFRCYYIARNAIYLSKKYKKLKESKHYRRAAYNRIILRLLFESNKIKKLKEGIRGIIDGYKM